MTDVAQSATAIPAIERTLELPAPPERVWTAITDPVELGKWFPDRAELDLRPGGDGMFTWTEHGSAAVRVEAIDAPRYFAWRWANDSDASIDAASEVTLVEWWLAPGADGGTTLKVRESGFTRESHRTGNEEGWTSEHAELVTFLGG